MRYIILLAIPFFLTGCETFFGKKAKEPLTGERQRVLITSENITPAPEVAHIYVGLPEAIHNQEWSMAGGNARHAMLPSIINANIKKVWEHSVGAGNGSSFQLFNSSIGFLSNSSYRLLNGPIAAEGKVFTIDAEGSVIATDLKTGEEVWQTLRLHIERRRRLREVSLLAHRRPSARPYRRPGAQNCRYKL